MTNGTRLQIRRATYRGRDGFTVRGQGGIFGISIFCETRDAAEHIRELVRRGIEETVTDFAGHTPGLSGYCTGCMMKAA
jgi:hypothetical protein